MVKAIEIGEGMEWGPIVPAHLPKDQRGKRAVLPATNILRSFAEMQRENKELRKRVKDLENMNTTLNRKNLELTVQNNNYKKIYDF